MAPYLHQISLLVRMRLTAMGHPAVSVSFSHNNVHMELLVGEGARVARLHVAGQSTLPQMLSTLRAKVPTSSKSWELLQASLVAGGLRVCPTSGTPALDMQDCSTKLKDALWTGLVALSEAVNRESLGKGATDLDAAMLDLSRLLERHARGSRKRGRKL